MEAGFEIGFRVVIIGEEMGLYGRTRVDATASIASGWDAWVACCPNDQLVKKCFC